MVNVLAKPATPKEQLVEVLTMALRTYHLGVTGDPLLHAETLAMGILAFKPRFVEVVNGQLRGIGVAVQKLADVDEMAKQAFLGLENSWNKHYPTLTPKQFLDTYEPPPPELNADDVDDWEFEIGSSEDYMQRHWDGSRRTRKGKLRDLGVRQDRPLKLRH